MTTRKLDSFGSGQQLWNTAKAIIPGGNQLLSKRAEMFLPDLWPAYYSKASGYKITDLDGNDYADFATMGVGSCVLGYADEDVNAAVKAAIDAGSMSSLNCKEEVDLTRKLLNLHGWADMARYTRSGGEACSVAIRIARAATKKRHVLFCGYHGWHDWYLSSNITDPSNLDQQLLSGLSSNGVPDELGGTAHPFTYNDFGQFEHLMERFRDDIAAVIMEPVRGNPPSNNFLESIRDLTSQRGVPLIFDEVTSGFRINCGGVHLSYGIRPDMAIFGKALGNGFPIAAVIGVRSIMNAAQDTFISSTMWTERVGYVAALATLEKFEANEVHKSLCNSGRKINEAWDSAARLCGIPIKTSGLLPLTHIDFLGDDPALMQTFYTQEMLKRGFLVGSSAYTTYAYDDEILTDFSKATANVFSAMSAHLADNSLNQSIAAGVKHTGFQRLA